MNPARTVHCLMHICHGWDHCLCWSDWLRAKLLVGGCSSYTTTLNGRVHNDQQLSNITTGQRRANVLQQP